MLIVFIGINKLLFINKLITEIALRNKTVTGQTFWISNMFMLTYSVLDNQHRDYGQVVFIWWSHVSVNPLHFLRCFNVYLPLFGFQSEITSDENFCGVDVFLLRMCLL